MNFHLKDLHLHFDAVMIQEAESIISSGDVQKIIEIKKDLWQLSFEYEGAVCQCQINAGKVRKYICSCVVFSLYKKCKHVTAICMLIQKIRLRNATLINPGETQHYKSIPLGKILQHTSQIELTNFLLDYAKTSPEITNALKARFIFNFPDEISLERDLVLTVQVEKYLSAKRPSENSLFDIYKSLEAYFAQSDGKLNQHETISSLNILNIISKNLNKLLVSTHLEKQKPIEFSKQLLTKLYELYRLFVAPEAKKNVTDLMLEGMAVMDSVTDHEWHEKFSNTLLLTVSKEFDYQTIKDQILHTYFRKIQHIENRSTWLLFTIQSDLIRGEKSDLEEIINLCNHDIDTLRSLISRLISKLHYDLVIKLIQQIQKSNNDYFKHYENELNTILLDMFIRIKNWKKTETLILKTYPMNPNSKTLEFVRERFPEDFQGLWEKLQIIKTKTINQQIALELSFAEITNDYTMPMETIIKGGDVKLLVENDDLFWKKNKNETIELYKSLAKIYLETHFGEPAQSFMRQLFHHLDKSGHREESKIIKKYLHSLFSERNLNEIKFEFPVI